MTDIAFLPSDDQALLRRQRLRQRRRRKWIIAAILIAVVLGGAAFKFFRKKDETITVQVTKVQRRDITEIVIANGRIQPVTQVLISPEVAGEIIDLPVEEGQTVKKGGLLLQIKPDNYQASRNSAEASHKFTLGSRSQAEAELEKAAADFKRSEELSKSRLTSPSEFQQVKTLYELAKIRLANSIHQSDQARFALDKAEDDLTKTRIVSPIDGTITKLKSQLGERVLGTSFNMGTEIMTVAQLDDMEARVDIGEIDIVLIEVGQHVRLEVDAFKDEKFSGTVTAIANAAKGSSALAAPGGGGNSQEAPKFEVRIGIEDKAGFRPGMSVTAEIETRSRKKVLAVPIQAVTTRLPGAGAKPKKGSPPPAPPAPPAAPPPKPGRTSEPFKPAEVVFAHEGGKAKMLTVKTGISDSDYFEIISGVNEGQEIVSGGYQAISTDLQDGVKVTVGPPADAPEKDAKDAR